MNHITKDIENTRIIVLSFLLLGAIQLIQGGYFPNLYLPMMFILLCCILLCRKSIIIDKRILTCLVACLLWYVMSAIYNGLTTTMLCRVIYILDLMLIYLICSGMKRYCRQMLQGVLLTVILQEVIGMFAYLGISMEGVIVAKRFMGTYQYANTMAMVMVIVIVITEYEVSVTWNHLLLIHYVFLILTGSVGGIIVFACVKAYLLFHQKKGYIYKELLMPLIAGICAILIYVSCFYLKSWYVTLAIFVITIYVSFQWKKISNKISGSKWLRILDWTGICIAFGGGMYLLHTRAVATFTERLWQMKDAFAVIQNNALFGIGSGTWKEKQELYRTYNYDVSLVHNSYLQVALEAGVPTLLLLLVIIGIILWDDRKKITWRKALLYGVLLHMMVDIDFFFLGYVAVIIACLTKESLKDDLLV